MNIDLNLLREVLDYDQNTGIFSWKISRGRNAKRGSVAGTKRANGYLDICLGRKKFKAHRLAWIYVHGFMPDGDIDHINGQRDDNRIVNLRDATRSQNLRNSRKRMNNTSGFKGVSMDKRYGRWSAYIKAHGRKIGLGYYSTPEAAYAAYCAAAEKYHGEFARTE